MELAHDRLVQVVWMPVIRLRFGHQGTRDKGQRTGGEEGDVLVREEDNSV